jgi:hypothetical protein
MHRSQILETLSSETNVIWRARPVCNSFFNFKVPKFVVSIGF